jgi:hypothetical protein
MIYMTDIALRVTERLFQSPPIFVQIGIPYQANASAELNKNGTNALTG